MQQSMEIQLHGELTEGKELIWSGSPDPQNKSIVSPARVFRILATAFGIVGIVLLVTGVIIQITVADIKVKEGMLGLEIPGGTFLFLAIMFTIFTFVYRQVPRNLLYAITNHRAIIMRTGLYTTVDSFGKHDIGQIRRLERSDGSGDIIFASPNPFGYNSQYNGSYGNGSNGNYGLNRYGSGIFTGIHDVRNVEHILISNLK